MVAPSSENMAALSCELVRERLDYDPETGLFRWRIDFGPKIMAGRLAGSLSKSRGYICIGINKRPYMAHRLAWLYVHGEWPREYIDHIDGDRANNRLSNLREATHVENQQNRKICRTNTSGLKGIAFDRNRGKWTAQITVNGKRVSLGRFNDPMEAHAAYTAAAARLFGEFGRSA